MEHQMKLKDYQSLISLLPVRQQSYVTKRSNWSKAEKKSSWLLDKNIELFKDGAITINRQDIFNSQGSIKELVLKTIYWGYP